MDDRGSIATEYALLVFLIAIAIAFGIGILGTDIASWFESMVAKLP